MFCSITITRVFCPLQPVFNHHPSCSVAFELGSSWIPFWERAMQFYVGLVLETPCNWCIPLLQLFQMHRNTRIFSFCSPFIHDKRHIASEWSAITTPKTRSQRPWPVRKVSLLQRVQDFSVSRFFSTCTAHSLCKGFVKECMKTAECETNFYGECGCETAVCAELFPKTVFAHTFANSVFQQLCPNTVSQQLCSKIVFDTGFANTVFNTANHPSTPAQTRDKTVRWVCNTFRKNVRCLSYCFYWLKWCPGAESNHRHEDFQDLRYF
jgi:hypothetical protein